jgi:lysophospholipase L1-like esterase
MAKRYAKPADVVMTYDGANPTSWGLEATYAVRGSCPAGLSAGLKAAGETVNSSPVFDKPCTVAFRRPKLDPFSLELTVRRAGTRVGVGTAQITPEDHLIVSVGDSLSSGEGVPEFPGSASPWRHKACHRSGNAGVAQAAQAIEDDDPHSSVTFVHLACSGADMQNGLLGNYSGVDGTGAESPQLTRARAIAGARRIDALVMSIGINDISFGPILKHCALSPHCPAVPFRFQNLGTFLDGALATLNGRYSLVAAKLTDLHVDPGRVFLSDYPDPTRNAQGAFGDYRTYDYLTYPGPRVSIRIDPAEMRFLHDRLLVPLNARGRAAAQAHGWKRLGGLYTTFRAHGLAIPTEAAGRWFVRNPESYARQGDNSGSFHPNMTGHQNIARLIEGPVGDLLDG